MRERDSPPSTQGEVIGNVTPPSLCSIRASCGPLPSERARKTTFHDRPSSWFRSEQVGQFFVIRKLAKISCKLHECRILFHCVKSCLTAKIRRTANDGTELSQEMARMQLA